MTELRTEDFDYHLPEELIASQPSARRDGARMLVVDRTRGTIESKLFSDLPDYLRPDDLFVLNNTRVVPSRFYSDDGKVELLRLEEPEPQLWRCLVRPGRKMKLGRSVQLAGTTGEVIEILENGDRLVRFSDPVDPEQHGELALPHYFGREVEDIDSERYQTVFAREPGAIAAPTAGLHFTPELLAKLPHTFLTLHVGVGTFRPVSAERIADHDMHSERFLLSETSATAINEAARVISVGTTVTRVLEHLASEEQPLKAASGETDIFIYPGFQFRRTGALLTNFHLPKSTLFMLVCAMAGTDFMREAYEKAIADQFRFYSYGDCMLIT